MNDESWPFVDPKNVAVFTNAFIIREGHAITHVYHDDEDGAWQFHCSHPETNSSDHMMIVALSEVADHDPSIAELHDLPFGWRAVREAPGMPWVRERWNRGDAQPIAARG
jgi:hypothetical protein